MKPGILSVVSKDEGTALLEASLQIMEEFGVRIEHAEAVDYLISAGAKKGGDGRICVGVDMARRILSSAPGRFRLHDRCGGAIEVGAGHSWTMCGGTVARVAEWPDWSLRSAGRDDVVRFTRLCDALPLVHTIVPVAEAQDVERSQAEVITFAETLANTTKFVWACPVEHRAAQAFVDMSRIVSGAEDLSTEPKTGLLVTVLPGLRLDDDCAATTILAAREGLPLISMGASMAGQSAPNTVAASAALKMAADLIVVILAQIVRPGAPVLLDIGVTTIDMASTDLGEAGPEYGLGIAAMAAVARELGLPTYSCALHCDAKTGDFQAGLEKMASMMTALLSGVDLAVNIGMVSRCSAASYEQVVMDHELCAFIQRFSKGVTVNDDTLGLDVIRDVGIDGNFLMHEHTVRHCRSGEIWYPRFLDRTAVGVEVSGIYDRAHKEADRILAEQTPEVDGSVKDELMSYVERV